MVWADKISNHHSSFKHNVYIALAEIKIQFDEAVDYYQQAIALKADNEKLYFALGNVYAKQDKLNEAIGNKSLQ